MSADLPIQMFDVRTRSTRGYGRANWNAKGKPTKQFLLRMPVSMLDHIESAAASQRRSMTAEILLRLEASMANESIDEHGVIVVHSTVPLK